MITILLLLAGAMLCFLGYLLIKKQNFFFVLLASNTAKEQTFLTRFGQLYFFTGCVGVILAFFAQRDLALFYLAMMMSLSAVFSIQFSKKMK